MGGGAPKMSDLKALTYEDRSPVGRAFTVRQSSFREATFSKGGGAPKMSDLKAPTYEVRSPVGRALKIGVIKTGVRSQFNLAVPPSSR